MKKILMLVPLLILISNSIYSEEKMRIAVMDLKPNNTPKSISIAVSDLIRADLVNTGMFTVVERNQMDQIFKEQSLQTAGCTDNSCAVQIGKLLSANKILVGEISQVGKTIMITARIVDVENGVAEFSATEKAKSMDNLDEAVSNIVNRLVDTIGGKRITDFAGQLDAPENVTASDGDYKDKIVVKWSGVEKADNYYVFRSKGWGGKFEAVSTTTKTTFTDTNVTYGDSYYYKVRAGIFSRFSGFSSTVSGMSGKSEGGFYLRGIIPGYGQIYYGNETKGYVFLSTFALSTVFLGYSLVDYADKKDSYDKLTMYDARETFDSKYDAYKKAANMRIYAAGIWAFVYAVNWLDLLCFNEPEFLDDSTVQAGGYLDFNIVNGNAFNGTFETKMILSGNHKF